ANVIYTGRDHNPEWIAFVAERVVGKSGIVFPQSTTLGVIDRSERSAYDVIIVDHGPQLETRAADVPWLVSQLAPGGVMLFDDWRPKHEGRIRRALAAVGGKWDIGEGPNT